MVKIKKKAAGGSSKRTILSLVFLTGAAVVLVSNIFYEKVNTTDGLLSQSLTATTKPLKVNLPSLQPESVYHGTFKSCLPDINKSHHAQEEEKGKSKQNCREYIIPKSSRQRVAFIHPPGAIGNQVLRIIQVIADYHEKRAMKTDYVIDVIDTSHVPPYGYGKTHGYTKIIRLESHPLVLEVADVVLTLWLQDEEEEQQEEQMMEDWRIALRQIVRFHCRLSHVSAHTALLTIDTAVLVTRPDIVIRQLVEFMVPHEDGLLSDTLMQSLLHELKVNIATAIRTIEASNPGAQRLIRASAVAENINDDKMYQELSQVLQQELESTKNLSVWPCPSFWSSASSSSSSSASSLSSMGTRLARALAPNCTDPLATCFVLRDKCEAKGDAECLGKG
ncbi:hypothetical protein ACA910_005761 [Epithemia clementina (nom. ined.)]